MKKIAVVKLGETSANVAYLHEVLQSMSPGLQIDAAELRSQTAGPSTMAAVRTLQKKLQINPNESMVIDEATADRLNSILANNNAAPETECYVEGTVTCNDRVLPGILVEAFDQDLPSKKIPRQPLGKAVYTDEKGRYRIVYTPADFKRAERDTADIVLVVSDKNKRVLHETTVYYNEATKATIDIDFELEKPGDEREIEYKRYIDAVTPLLDKEVTLAALKAADQEFLRNETNIPPDHLRLLIESARWEQRMMRTPVPAEIIYGIFRQSFPVKLSAWTKYNYEQLAEAVKRSIAARIIQNFTDDQLKAYLSLIMQMAVKALHEKPAKGLDSAGSILSTVIADENILGDFMRRYQQSTQSDEEFWSTMAADPAFRDKVPALKMTLKLSFFTNNNLPIIKSIQQRNVKNLEELTDLDLADWKKLIKDSNAPLPAHVGGEGDEKLTNYASSILALMEQEYPNQYIAKTVKDEHTTDIKFIKESLEEKINLNEIGLLNTETVKFKGDAATQAKAKKALASLKKEMLSFPEYQKRILENDSSGTVVKNDLRSGIHKFLLESKNFNFIKNPVDAYLKTDDGKEAVNRIADKDKTAVVKQVKRMQRVYNVTGDAITMSTLLDSGVHSSWQIASMSAAQYLQLMDGKMDTQRILSTQAKATDIAEQTIMTYHEMYDFVKQDLPWAVSENVPSTEAFVKVIPDYEELFGSFDLCECGHCRSVYSPAAYFVSLMHDLLGGKFMGINNNLFRPHRELMRRRPDLRALKLSCENTDTEIPYIDLVNEILEAYVAEGKLDAGDAYDTSEFTAEELAASPQFQRDKAYMKLMAATYPATLPYNINHETARAYLEYLGSSKYELENVFKTNELPASLKEIAAERINISEKEHEILTKRNFAGESKITEPYELFGYRNKTIPLGHASRIRMADVFITKTNISYKELVEILKTSFINPLHNVHEYLSNKTIDDNPILKVEREVYKTSPVNQTVIKDTDTKTIILAAPDRDQCNISKTEIVYRNGETVSDEDFAMINRFIRLWKKLGCTIEELDMLLMKLSDVKPEAITPETIYRISSAIAIKKKLNIPVENLITIWADIETKKEKSPFDKMFSNKTLKVEEKLQLNVEKNAFKDKGIKIDTHVTSLMSAFHLSEPDIKKIRKETGLDDISAELTITSLSAILRYAVLGKALRLTQEELVGLRLLTPSINPFASPADTDKFIALVESIKSSPFKIPQLLYIYLHRQPDALKIEPTPAFISNMAKAIRDGLNKIEADNKIPETPDLQDLSQKLGKIFDPQLVAQVIGTLDDTFTYKVDLITLPAPIPDTLKDKCRYDEDLQTLNCKGILTPQQLTELKNMAPADAAFNAAADSLYASPAVLYNTMFYGFMTEGNVQELLYNQPQEQKLIYFENLLVPFLKTRLSSIYIRQTIGDSIKMESRMGGVLFDQVIPHLETDMLLLKNGGLDAEYFDDMTLGVSKIKRVDPQINFDWGVGSPDETQIAPGTFSIRWTGKILSPSSEEFTFYTETDDGVRLWIDNQLIIDQWVDQTVTAHKGKIKFKAGQMYDIKMEYYQNVGAASAKLKWSSPTLSKSIIPAENLFSSAFLQKLFDNYVVSSKISMLVSGFGLKHEEVSHFTTNKQSFNNFDLAKICSDVSAPYKELSFNHWLRLYDYTKLRNALPVTEQFNLITIFKSSSLDFNTVFTAVKNATGWNQDSLKVMMGNNFGEGFFNMPALAYRNEIFLKQMQACMDMEMKLAISVSKLSVWASARITFETAKEIVNTVKAHYEDEDWFQVAKEVNNKLRTQRRDALVDYLLADKDIQDMNIFNANDLYQYFLIDVEMDSCMVTSRIVQANASIQLFVQRCLLNLEKNVPPQVIDKDHWEWMKKYRVWEANRKVFLYPENWIEPELRDGKSPFFKDLENELLQGEVTDETVELALLNYLQKLDEVAKLDIRGMYENTEDNTVHVFGRTFNPPFKYFYRTYSIDTKVWSPWEKVQADIEGVHLLPIVWNRKLYLFWTVIKEVAIPLNDEQRMAGATPANEFEIKLAWSEYRQKSWTPKMMSEKVINTTINDAGHGFTTQELLTMRGLLEGSVLRIRIFALTLSPNQYPVGEFVFDGYKSMPGTVTKSNTIDKFPPLVHLRGTYTSAMSYKETGIVTDNENNNQLILYKGEFPKENNGNAFEDYREDIVILGETPGRFKVLSPPNSTQFDITKSFFFLNAGHVYYVYRLEYQESNQSNSTENRNRSLDDGDGDTQTTYRWLDNSGDEDNQSESQEMKWTAPISFVNGNATGYEINGDLGYQPSGDNGWAKNNVLVSDSYTFGSAAIAENLNSANTKRARGFAFVPFIHAYVPTFIRLLNQYGVRGLFTVQNQAHGELNDNFKPIADSSTLFHNRYKPNEKVATPYPHQIVDFSESGAYSLYNWEIFFHIPMIIANRLSKNQRFAEAMRWYHFIFDPTSVSLEPSPKRFWNLIQFKKTPAESIQDLLDKLKQPDWSTSKRSLKDQINQWKDNPFNPHLIARKRPIAYMKNVLMKYLDNLIAWGDQLFRQDTMESVTEATQIYVLAAELLGKRKEKVPQRFKNKAETYASLRPSLDEFDNAMVTLETMFPYYSTKSVKNGTKSKTNKLADTVKSYYFCIPDNDKLQGYWDTIEDRLFKIRHCQNIEGIERKLSLFEPPIDPALLVQAVAGGIDIGSVLNDISSALPSYKFNYIIQKAHEFCNELKSLASSILSALEKKDAEQLGMLRATQETAMLGLAREIKKMQYEESVKARENILKTRETTVQRWKHYKKLLGDDSPKEPSIGSTIAEIMLPQNQESKVEGRLISSYEKQDLQKSKEAAESQSTAGMWEVWSGIAHSVPNFNIEPWGVGTTFGGANVGSSMGAVAKSWSNDAATSNVYASKASKMGNFFRREQEWTLQCNTAAKEIMAIDKQIIGAEIRINIASKERDNHEVQIENSKRIEEFLRNKYTREELYGWMQGEISTVFFQCYQMAYDLAKKAEKCYRFELGITQSNFIQFGYWDSFRKGLMSGERLSLALRQLEKAYMDQNKREYEITKHISLQQIAPGALLQLKEKGLCEIELPEWVFDLDYPGHFMRRIKSVSVSIPCIAGPYTGVNCTMVLLNSETRVLNTGDYEKQEDDTRFMVNYGALQSIATSNAQNDSGMFELSFRDERYLPFEGQGVISRWKIDMPQQNNQFDFNTISDVVIHLKYTAREGGNALRTKANAYINANVPKGGARLFSLKHDFPNEWYKFMMQADEGELQNFEALLRDNHFAYRFKGKIGNMSFSNVQLIIIPEDSVEINPKHPRFGNVAVSTLAQIIDNKIMISEAAIAGLPAVVRKPSLNRLDTAKLSNVLLLFEYSL